MLDFHMLLLLVQTFLLAFYIWTLERNKHFWITFICSLHALSVCYLFTLLYVWVCPLLSFFFFFFMMLFPFLISLNLLFQETPWAILRFSQRSCIENQSVVAEVLQKPSSWKRSFTIKRFRPLYVRVFGIFLICVAFHQIPKRISEEKGCVCASRN